jgi:hypothetical protein
MQLELELELERVLKLLVAEYYKILRYVSGPYR